MERDFFEIVYDIFTGEYCSHKNPVIAYASAYHADGGRIDGPRCGKVRARVENLPEGEGEIELRRLCKLDRIFSMAQGVLD